MIPEEQAFTPVPRNLRLRMGLLLGMALAIAIGFVAYALYARGVFDRTQRLVLVTEDAEGVSLGSEMTYAGFPIGRVRHLELGNDGLARIHVEVGSRHARWLRTSSIFTLEKAFFGPPRLRAHAGAAQDPPLADGAQRALLRADASEDVPRILGSLRGALDNVERLTAAGGSLQASLDNLQATTRRLAGERGLLAATLGSDADARKVVAAVEQASRLLASLDRTSARLEGVLGKADERLFGRQGVVDTAQGAVTEMRATLVDLRETLRKADAVLVDAQQVGSSTKAATTDLATLRTEVDTSLRKVHRLIDEVNRKWPFERDTEIRLP